MKSDNTISWVREEQDKHLYAVRTLQKIIRIIDLQYQQFKKP